MNQEIRLSRREKEVARLLLQGKSNKQIALALSISESTVEFHLKNIYTKLGVDSRVEATIKLRETPGILGESTVDNTDKMSIIGSNSNELDSNNKGFSNVRKRISFAEIIGYLVTHKFPFIAWLLLVLVIILAYVLQHRPPWKYEREGEHPDDHTVGMVLQRSEASEQMAHGQFGTVPAWPAQAGYVRYENIKVPGTDHLLLRLRYSKHSASEVLILVYLDDEKEPRARILPVNQSDWNKFVWTDVIDLGEVKRGVHSIKFYTDGQVYGVADLDKFELTAGTP